MSFNIQDLKPINDDNTQNWTEGSLRVKDVNDAGRADEGMICRWFFDWRGDASGAGTASAYTAASQTKPSAYYDGFRISLVLPVNNSADATLNVDSLAAIPILRTNGLPVQDDDLVANVPHDFVYFGGSFYALSVPGLGSAAYLAAGTQEGDVPVLDAFRTIPAEQQGMVGQLIWRSSTTVPLTWAVPNGQSLAQATYPDLYAEIGDTFGGDATHFNLPDVQKRVLVGAGPEYAIGDTGGEETVSLTGDQNGPHQHEGGTVGTNQPNSTSAGSALAVAGSGGSYGLPATAFSGSGAPHENMPPYIVLYPLYKVGYPAT